MTGAAAIGVPLLISRAASGSGNSPGTVLNLTAGCNVNVVAQCSVVVDQSGTNNGSGPVPGLIFGPVGSNGCVQVGISSGTASNLTSGGAPGLCFFTSNTKRIGITGGGCVQIGLIPGNAVTNLTAGCRGPTVQVQGVRPCSVGLAANSCLATGVIGSSHGNVCSAGICGHSLGSCGSLSAGNAVGVRGISGNAPGIVGTSNASSGIVGATGGILPCIKPATICIAGVTGVSLSAAGTPGGKAIGVRGISSAGPGVLGTSCLSSGVVGATAFIPCIKSPTAFIPCLKSPASIPGAGVTGRSIGSCGNVSAGKGIGVLGVSAAGPGISGASCLASGVLAITKGNACTAALCATSVCSHTLTTNGALSLGDAVGVRARSGKGPALQGTSVCSAGICAQSSTSVVGKFTNNSKAGDRSATVQFQPGVCTSATNAAGCLQTWNVGVSGPGNVCSIPPGSFFIGKPGKSGGQGVPGLVLGPTGLQVTGSISACGGLSNSGGLTAKTVSLTASPTAYAYQIQTSCFAVLVDASGLSNSNRHDDQGHPTFTVTLPPASSKPGMLVFIDKVDQSHNSVTVAPNKGDTVCGYPSLDLGAAYSSVELISDGKNTWFRLSCTGATAPTGQGGQGY